MSPSRTECECTGPGWCDRHQVRKTAHWVKLCQTRRDYWEAWEEGRGPGQLKPRGVASLAAPAGPGTELSRMLGKCMQYPHAAKMDRWGPDGCTEQLAQCVRWLRAWSCAHGQCMARPAAERMILRAINTARSDAI